MWHTVYVTHCVCHVTHCVWHVTHRSRCSTGQENLRVHWLVILRVSQLVESEPTGGVWPSWWSLSQLVESDPAGAVWASWCSQSQLVQSEPAGGGMNQLVECEPAECVLLHTPGPAVCYTPTCTHTCSIVVLFVCLPGCTVTHHAWMTSYTAGVKFSGQTQPYSKPLNIKRRIV